MSRIGQPVPDLRESSDHNVSTQDSDSDTTIHSGSRGITSGIATPNAGSIPLILGTPLNIEAAIARLAQGEGEAIDFNSRDGTQTLDASDLEAYADKRNRVLLMQLDDIKAEYDKLMAATTKEQDTLQNLLNKMKTIGLRLASKLEGGKSQEYNSLLVNMIRKVEELILANKQPIQIDSEERRKNEIENRGEKAASRKGKERAEAIEETGDFSLLPVELIEHIVSLLDIASISKLTIVNRMLNYKIGPLLPIIAKRLHPFNIGYRRASMPILNEENSQRHTLFNRLRKKRGTTKSVSQQKKLNKLNKGIVEQRIIKIYEDIWKILLDKTIVLDGDTIGALMQFIIDLSPHIENKIEYIKTIEIADLRDKIRLQPIRMHFYIAIGFVNLVISLLERNFTGDILTLDRDGRTLLLTAILEKEEALAVLLLKRPDIDLTVQDPSTKSTVLHLLALAQLRRGLQEFVVQAGMGRVVNIHTPYNPTKLASAELLGIPITETLEGMNHALVDALRSYINETNTRIDNLEETERHQLYAAVWNLLLMPEDLKEKGDNQKIIEIIKSLTPFIPNVVDYLLSFGINFRELSRHDNRLGKIEGFNEIMLIVMKGIALNEGALSPAVESALTYQASITGETVLHVLAKDINFEDRKAFLSRLKEGAVSNLHGENNNFLSGIEILSNDTSYSISYVRQITKALKSYIQLQPDNKIEIFKQASIYRLYAAAWNILLMPDFAKEPGDTEMAIQSIKEAAKYIDNALAFLQSFGIIRDKIPGQYLSLLSIAREKKALEKAGPEKGI